METQGEEQGQEPSLDFGRYLAALWKWRGFILADAPAMARHADGIIMVAESGQTSRRDMIGALQTLCANGTPVAGVVLNRVRA